MGRKSVRTEQAAGAQVVDSDDAEGGEQHPVEIGMEERDLAKLREQLKKTGKISIPEPNMQTMTINIEGDAPLVMHRFAEKAKKEIEKKQAQRSSMGRKGGAKEARNPQQEYEQAAYQTKDGWYGIPTTAFRASMIRACATTEFAMTVAKLGVCKVLPDGFDKRDGTPLVRISKGKPRMHDGIVRLQGRSSDMRYRPMWEPGWAATVRVRFDADMFEPKDVVNLLHRAGLQVGILEGRPSSPRSCGMDWGTFQVKQGFAN
jgi:hypothetical protein